MQKLVGRAHLLCQALRGNQLLHDHHRQRRFLQGPCPKRPVNSDSMQYDIEGSEKEASGMWNVDGQFCSGRRIGFAALGQSRLVVNLGRLHHESGTTRGSIIFRIAVVG